MTVPCGATMSEKFDEFHADNPRVYDVLVHLARQWVAATGRHKLGIATLYERARWEIAIATNDPDFKLNNNWRSYYARLMMIREPELKNLFEVRVSEADSWLAEQLSVF